MALANAEADLRAASDALVAARAAFDADPSASTESALESAEREQRRAARLREARERDHALALDAERAAAKVRARERRAELREHRTSELLTSLGHRLQDFLRLYEQLSGIVQGIDEDLLTDAALCREHNALAEAAGETEQLEPLDAETVRLAIGLELAEHWDDEPTGIRSDLDMTSAIAAIDRFRHAGTPLEFHRRLELAQMETEHAFGSAPLHRWLATVPPIAWGDHTPAAERIARAAKLLEQLRPNHDQQTDS